MSIVAQGLHKRYGEHHALAGADLSVRSGTVLALLGPNGAGKTTTIRILTTLLVPDSGTARVAGYDVLRQPREVRRRIGLTGQNAAVDGRLTGRQNLRLIGVLHGLSRRRARTRATELLDQFGLADAADRFARTYSGGMRRRLDLAASLVAEPAVLFLDEPTTGLDPVGRELLWRSIREQVAGGVTVLLTTQYLEEADQLADHIVVLNAGRVIAFGTSDELKRRVGEERLEVSPRLVADLPKTTSALARVSAASPTPAEDGRSVSVPLLDGAGGIEATACALREAGVEIREFAVRRPSLVDVFVAFTGQADAEQRSAA